MSGPAPTCTFLIIAVTTVISYLAFKNYSLERKCIFNPRAILAGNEYHRLLSSGFLHAGWFHLAMNMVTLYMFGRVVEGVLGASDFLLIYFGAILGGNLLSLYIHRHHQYEAYGASGGVCGVIFASILISPGGRMVVFPIPFPMPTWVYAIVFIAASLYAMRASKDNIGHDAHLGGAIIGLLIAVALNPFLVRSNPLIFFIVVCAAVVLLVYLWVNPLMLPIRSYVGRGSRSAREPASSPTHKHESLEIDAILDKIAKQGMDSLTPEERGRLGEASGKYQRRAESKKPESGLAI